MEKIEGTEDIFEDILLKKMMKILLLKELDDKYEKLLKEYDVIKKKSNGDGKDINNDKPIQSSKIEIYDDYRTVKRKRGRPKKDKSKIIQESQKDKDFDKSEFDKLNLKQKLMDKQNKREQLRNQINPGEKNLVLT